MGREAKLPAPFFMQPQKTHQKTLLFNFEQNFFQIVILTRTGKYISA